MKSVFEEFKKELDKESSSRKASDKNNEEEVLEEYNERQLFELLQNIDDQGSKEALIKLDTSNNILLVSNTGEPFSKGGLQSLMMANLSPKRFRTIKLPTLKWLTSYQVLNLIDFQYQFNKFTKTFNAQKKGFIGNKGLGFRSLLNWLGKIYVKSTNLSIEFSESNRNKIEQQEGTERSICSTPEWIDSNNSREWINKINFDNKYTTHIAVYYEKDSESEVIRQVDELSEELMFFINYIEKIHIIKDNENKVLDKKKWERRDKEIPLPSHLRKKKNLEESCQLKIILPPNNEEVRPELFSYFPTNIEVNFPALIHANFSLDSSRNTITADKKGKNEFIVQELAKFIIEVAESLKEDDSNWKAYEFVNIRHKNEILKKFGFYTIIETWKKTAKIYPCIDNQYRSNSEWKYYGKEFSIFMEKYSEVLGDILKKIPNSLGFSAQYKSHSDITKSLNQISKKISCIDERSKLINHILNIQSRNPSVIPNLDQLILLINQDKKLKEELFFYNEIFLDLEIPSFIKIDYIYPDLQNILDINELKKIATVEEFDIQRDLIERIIKSDKPIQVKLQALYPLRKFERPLKSIEGITNKYIRDERILKIFEEKEIIEDYESLGISKLEELDKFLVWLGAKKFNAQQILKIVVDKNNAKKDISLTLQALFILKDEFSDNLSNNRIRTDKDIFVLDAVGDIRNIIELFPYNETCKKENIIASKSALGLEQYSDNEIKKFLEWLGIKEFNPQNVAIEKIKQLKEKELDKKEAKEIFQFLYNSKLNNQLPDITPETDTIYIFHTLSKKLFFRTKLTEKYFDESQLLPHYDKLGFDKNKKSQDFFSWLGVIDADENLIVEQIFKSDIDAKEKLKELFSLFKKNNSIKRPEQEFTLKTLNGKEKEVKELYINNDITRFCKREKVVNIPLHEYSEEFFKWLGLKEPSRKQIVERLLNLLTNKDISIKDIEEIISLLMDKYEESDEIDKTKPRYLFNEKQEVFKVSELYQHDELVYKHIPDSIICKKLNLDEKFSEWIGIKKAEPFMIIRTLLKQKHENINDIFELWKQDSEIKPLPKNISVKLLNKNSEKTLANKLFLKTSLTPFYDDSELIVDYEQLGLDKSDDTEKFLLWLGVNQYIKYEKDGDFEKVYKLNEISKLEFPQLFSLLEAENILNNSGAKSYLQKQFPEYKYWILKDYGIDLVNPPVEYENKQKKIGLLKQFGIKEDFEEKNTLFLLQQLTNIDKEGRYAPIIYKTILGKTFDFTNKKFLIFTQKKEYKPNKELMYLHTSEHPKSVLKQYDFIDLPINLDTDKVFEAFGVDRIIDINYKVHDFNQIVSDRFDEYFEKLKPYFLSFGLVNIDERKTKEELASKLKSLKIKFGTFDCYADNKKITIENFEMISSQSDFYIFCEGIVDDFSKDANLTNSIENILLSIDFNEHGKFRDIFRYGDFEELEHILSKEYGSTILEEAKVLLGKKSNPTPSEKPQLDESEKLMQCQQDFKVILNEYYSDFEQNLYIWCGKHHQEEKFLSLIDKYLNIKINTIEELNYSEYIKKYVKNNFHFELIEVKEYIDIQAVFTKNKKLIEYDKIRDITEYRSMLHFDNQINDIKKYILSLKEQKPKKPKSSISDMSIIGVDLENNTPSKNSPKKPKSPWKPPVNDPSTSPEKTGAKSEEKVYKVLVKEFGIKNVHWDADRTSDGYGYDFRYRNKNNETKYVEVKTYSHKGRFYISPNEVKFAKDNKDAYELYLVDDEIIYKVNNFHKLKKVIENYTVNFSIENLKVK